ncbi:TIGR03915 family putative DNA repair protein [Cellulophaga sp. HaHa_2_1]|uniref:TIGR03915 family putative DNA repair protein n=1 Tax=Cellulophaga sp. HaHa_2_1 TaxID=2749994 RepID=UPI001C4FFDEE|nr:TIGR03915 family putative DNA repair protein [Cellulophaga sp. HaHa_2_1]QXP53009.1 TIGR03915 family putative DNA repair protein [Cellulophaga sp. HaHa_2_1]
MNEAKILVYDGSFNGYLTAVFQAFEQKLTIADIQKEESAQSGLFSDAELVYTDVLKSKRVWNGIQKKNNTAIKNIYFAFLSETKKIELLLYRYIQKLFSETELLHLNFSDDIVLKISQLAKSVGREKHRMEAFVRFQLTKDAIYFSNIEPDFDVLPLISKHFKSRYADQQWIIYDVKRKYGIYYNLDTVEFITLDMAEIHNNKTKKSSVFTDEEYEFQDLWNNYFKSTNIASRVNLKLHTQHVPKRYWKYLSEKKAVS